MHDNRAAAQRKVLAVLPAAWLAVDSAVVSALTADLANAD